MSYGWAVINVSMYLNWTWKQTTLCVGLYILLLAEYKDGNLQSVTGSLVTGVSYRVTGTTSFVYYKPYFVENSLDRSISIAVSDQELRKQRRSVILWKERLSVASSLLKPVKNGVFQSTFLRRRQPIYCKLIHNVGGTNKLPLNLSTMAVYVYRKSICN